MPFTDPIILTEIFIGLAFILGSWTVILGWFIQSKKLLRWKRPGLIIVMGFFLSLITNSIGILFAVYDYMEYAAIMGAIVSLLILIAVAVYAVGVSYQIIKLESFAIMPGRAQEKPLKKSELEKIDKLGMPAVDQLLLGPVNRLPFIIFGPQGTHPWSLAHDFAADGLINGESCVYIATTRPPEFVIEQMDKLMKDNYGKSLAEFRDRFAIVDCFTPFAGFGERKAFPSPEDYKKAGWVYAEADPRDLNELHIATAKIRSMLKPGKVRIIYDTFSTIVELTDQESLHQFLMHQIAFEEKFGYISCYVIRREEDLEWLELLVSGLIKLTMEENERTLELVKMPAKFRPGKFKIDDANKIMRRVTKPKFSKEMSERTETQSDDYGTNI